MGKLTKHVKLAKVDEEKRLVGGVVYEPEVPDAHGDWASADTIEKMAHGFMMNYALQYGAIGIEHVADVSAWHIAVVESYLAPVDFTLGTDTVTKGSWVLIAKIQDDGLWEAVKAGTFTGWSFEGYGERTPRGLPMG